MANSLTTKTRRGWVIAVFQELCRQLGDADESGLLDLAEEMVDRYSNDDLLKMTPRTVEDRELAYFTG